jgi:hypothetical protein
MEKDANEMNILSDSQKLDKIIELQESIYEETERAASSVNTIKVIMITLIVVGIIIALVQGCANFYGS